MGVRELGRGMQFLDGGTEMTASWCSIPEDVSEVQSDDRDALNQAIEITNDLVDTIFEEYREWPSCTKVLNCRCPA